MLLYAVTIFLSAFLLFQVQPLIAKIILPWFGGSSAVWSTCMLFFQVELLLGYLYAHWLHEKLSARRQAVVHTLLLAASLALLPLAPDAAWKGEALRNPAWAILGLLATTVGLPYFVLSSTSPLLQAWYAKTHSGSVPYRLFALSNLASMMALLSYPAVFEPRMSVRTQSTGWSIGYAVFAVLCVFTAWLALGKIGMLSPVVAASDSQPRRPGWVRRGAWIALPAVASTLLLATTSFLTHDVAAIPFLWVLPLIAYLLTFIICFDSPRLYSRPLFLFLLVPALGVMAYLQWHEGGSYRVPTTVALSIASLFVLCMVCHGEMVRLKPHPRYLTEFYVMMSVGGALGGLFVGLIAANLFNAAYEFPIGLASCGLLVFGVLAWGLRGRFHEHLIQAGLGVAAAALVVYLIILGIVVRDLVKDYRVVARNFYGSVRIEDYEDAEFGTRRKLLHGSINHGEQVLDPAWRRSPVTYFCPESGIGRGMRSLEGKPRRIGILGLGCGTLLAYSHPGDYVRIYEINPVVLDLARREFSYIQDSPARVETVLGDGRLVLEREPAENFDILVMDAFSGDSVPVHLVTLEAFRTYARHLAPGGILAVNISNRYLDLRPVMARAARELGRVALVFDYNPWDVEPLCFSNTWVLMVDEHSRSRPGMDYGIEAAPRSGFRPWTDDYSNMFGILK